MIQLAPNHIEAQQSSATKLMACTQCGKNLRVVKQSSILRNDFGTFCGESCSQIYKVSHDHSSVFGQLMNGRLDLS